MKRNLFSSVTLAAVLITSAANAASVTINTNLAPAVSTTALTGFSTTGSMMTGMKVTAGFSNGSSDSQTWATTGLGAGGVTSSLFSLSMSGDTFGGTWTLINTNSFLLTSLSIDAGAGNTVFDMIVDPELTSGSARGGPFVETTGLGGNIVANYSKSVSLNADPFQGDLFALLLVNFTGLDAGGVASDGRLLFTQDTDNLLLPGDLRGTPIPGALPLFASGLGVLGFLAHRRKRKTEANA
jgi:hypothetical protein